jgi:threonine dehydrogenase-like Zn-dependent dehydrogenase
MDVKRGWQGTKEGACAMKGRLIVFEDVGKAALREFEVPRPKAGEVLLENEYTVVSAGTERANLLNMQNTGPSGAPDFATVRAPEPSKKYPFHPGYCGIGKVIAVGEGVDSAKIGKRALAVWSGHRSHAIQQDSRLTTVDDERIDSLDASMTHIASFGLHGVRKLRLEIGESAMALGLGLLGMFAVQAAALSGAVPVIASDFDKKRRELALALGADYAFSPDEEHLPEKIREITYGKGVNGIVEATGSAKALQQALTYAAREGRVSLLGCTRVSDAPIDFYQYVHQRGVSLIGAHTMARPQAESRPGCWTEKDDYRTLLALLATKKLKVRPLISELVSPKQAPEVYRRLAEGGSPPLGTVFDWKEAI